MDDVCDVAWAAARSADPGAMSRDEIARLLGEVRRARAWLDSVEVRAARRLRELEAVGSSEPVDAAIANDSGLSGRDAGVVSDREEVCDEAPAIEDALAEGSISSAFVDVIAQVAKTLPETVRAEFLGHEDELLRRAARSRPDLFRRECRRLARKLLAAAAAADGVDELERQRKASKVKRWVDKATGMCHTHLELDPVRDSRLHTLVNAEMARLRAADQSDGHAGRLSWDELQVAAFIAATTDWADRSEVGQAPGNGRAGGGAHDSEGSVAAAAGPSGCRVDRVPEITLLVSYEWLIGVAFERGICETETGEPIPIDTVRRLCCDAEVLPAVLDGEGRVVDHGRSRRTASREQRRRLRAEHRGCAFPGCSVGFDACRIHHVRHWLDHHGPTDHANLLPLCERHHHLVHEGGWTLTMTTDRVATWRRPDGTTHHVGSTIDRTRPAA